MCVCECVFNAWPYIYKQRAAPSRALNEIVDLRVSFPKLWEKNMRFAVAKTAVNGRLM